MSTSIEAKLNIPDLWYDFYARFLPGLAFVAALYYFLIDVPKMPDGNMIIVGIFAGYLTGLITQPISSRLAGWIHRIVASVHHEDPLYVDYAKKQFDNRHSMIISKMHGETVFFIQCAILCIFFLSTQIYFKSVSILSNSSILTIICSIIFILESIEIADRRFLRAKKELDIINIK